VAPWRGVHELLRSDVRHNKIHSARPRPIQTERSGPGADISGEDHHNTQAQIPQTFADQLASADGT